MGKKKNSREIGKILEKLKVPKVLIAGLIMASVLGWTGIDKLKNIKNYYQIKQIFPDKARMTQVLDGDTFIINNGLTVRLLGINAPDRGQPKYNDAAQYLSQLIKNREIYLEYDRYQDDKFGRILAYVWIKCFEEIKTDCRGDKVMVNELMIKKGYATPITYQDRAKLKYEDDFRKDYENTKN